MKKLLLIMLLALSSTAFSQTLNWQKVEVPSKGWISDIIEIGDNEYIAASNAMFFFKNGEWTNANTPASISGFYRNLAQVGTTYLALSPNEQMIFSTDKGANWLAYDQLGDSLLVSSFKVINNFIYIITRDESNSRTHLFRADKDLENLEMIDPVDPLVTGTYVYSAVTGNEENDINVYTIIVAQDQQSQQSGFFSRTGQTGSWTYKPFSLPQMESVQEVFQIGDSVFMSTVLIGFDFVNFWVEEGSIKLMNSTLTGFGETLVKRDSTIFISLFETGDASIFFNAMKIDIANNHSEVSYGKVTMDGVVTNYSSPYTQAYIKMLGDDYAVIANEGVFTPDDNFTNFEQLFGNIGYPMINEFQITNSGEIVFAEGAIDEQVSSIFYQNNNAWTEVGAKDFLGASALGLDYIDKEGNVYFFEDVDSYVRKKDGTVIPYNSGALLYGYSESVNGDIYFLKVEEEGDFFNILSLARMKKGTYTFETVFDSLANMNYAISETGAIVVTGADTEGNPVSAISTDNGSTWTQNALPLYNYGNIFISGNSNIFGHNEGTNYIEYRENLGVAEQIEIPVDIYTDVNVIEGIIFVSTPSGIYYKRPADAEWKHTLQQESVISVKADNLGKLWAHTNTGLWVTEQSVVAVEELEEISFKAYPNPAVDFINIDAADNAHVEIFNMAGAKVLEQDLNAGSSVNVKGLAQGAYTLVISRNGSSSSSMINIVR